MIVVETVMVVNVKMSVNVQQEVELEMSLNVKITLEIAMIQMVVKKEKLMKESLKIVAEKTVMILVATDVLRQVEIVV